jgi:mRNA surveillance protein pelota
MNQFKMQWPICSLQRVPEMQQIKRIENGVRLRVQHEDDLWTLSQLVRPGCFVGMMGFRRDQTTGTQEGGRSKAADRKPVWIVLEAESCEFQAFTDNLRIHGIISEAAFDKGSHHTHAVSPRDEVEITWTEGLGESDRSLIAESLKDSGRGRVAIIVVESDEILLFEVAQHGMRDVSMFTLRGGGKREAKSTEVRETFLRNSAKETAMVFSNKIPIIICGPGLAREQFEVMLKEAGDGYRILNIATSIGGRSAANEIMREGGADAILGEYAMAKQVRLIEEAMARIAKKEAIAYGQQSILDALEQGAIESFVIEAGLLRSDSLCKDRSWSDVANEVRASGGEVIQASIDHDAGEQLMGLGGAIGLLRWTID